MRLSREKIVHLSHVLVQALERKDNVKLLADSNNVRLVIFNVIHQFVKLDERIEEEARRKIQSVKKDIPEGSREWDVQFRRNYEEEWEKMRKLKG